MLSSGAQQLTKRRTNDDRHDYSSSTRSSTYPSTKAFLSTLWKWPFPIPCLLRSSAICPLQALPCLVGPGVLVDICSRINLLFNSVYRSLSGKGSPNEDSDVSWVSSSCCISRKMNDCFIGVGIWFQPLPVRDDILVSKSSPSSVHVFYHKSLVRVGHRQQAAFILFFYCFNFRLFRFSFIFPKPISILVFPMHYFPWLALHA